MKYSLLHLKRSFWLLTGKEVVGAKNEQGKLVGGHLIQVQDDRV